MSNNIQVVLSVNKATYTQAMQEAQRQLDTFAGKARNAGHSTVSSMQASSAAIRLVEGGMTNNIRAVERFISTIPGVGAALKAAFPVVGALAFAGLIARMGEEVYQFIQKINQAPKAIAQGFSSMTLQTQTAADELSKTNHQLENQIALFEHKPVNNVALAIDDARISADKLADSLLRDQERIQELLKTQHIGFLGELLGKAPTSDEEKIVNAQNDADMADANALVIATHKYGPNSPQVLAAKARIAADNKAAEQADQDEIDYLAPGPNRAANVTGDQTANINIRQGDLARRLASDDYQQALSQNASDEAKSAQIENARKAAEQQKQLQQQQIQTWQQNLEGLKALRNLSTNDEANYWIKMASTVKEGSLGYRKAITEANKLIAQQIKEGAEERQKFAVAGLTSRQFYTDNSGVQHRGTLKDHDLTKDSDAMKDIGDDGKAIGNWFKNFNQGVAIQKANADAIAEQSLQMAIATGQISRLDAAQVQARLHTQEYTEALKQLQENRAAVLSRTDLSPAEQNQQTSAIDNQILAFNGQRTLQSQQDQAAINSATALGQLRDAAAELALQFTDTGAQLSDLMARSITGINESLSSALMAHANNGYEYRLGIQNALAGQLRQMGAGGLNTAFENIEGGLLGKFSGTKPDGSSAGNALWVRFAGTGSSSSSSSAEGMFSGLLSKLFDHNGSPWNVMSGSRDPLGLNAPSVDTSGWASSLGFGSDSDSYSLQRFASGGDTPANRPFLVGENGPEMMRLPFSAHITPNNQLSSLGNTNHIAYIDASGATDPEAVTRQVHAAMQSYGPYAVSASVGAVNELKKRIPLSKR